MAPTRSRPGRGVPARPPVIPPTKGFLPLPPQRPLMWFVQLSSNSVTFINLLKSNIGAGFLALPYAFYNFGLTVRPASYHTPGHNRW